MHKRHIASSIALVAVLAVAIAAFAGGAAASGHTPNDNESYDVYDGATVDIYEANNSNVSHLVVNTSNTATLSSINVTVTYNETDSDGNVTRELTLYKATNESDDYTRTKDVDANDDTTADSDRHDWAINHSEFRDAPVTVNDTTDVWVEVVAVNSDDDAAELNFTFNLSNADDRSVVVVDDASLDDDNIGSDAETLTEEVGFFSFAGFGANETDYVIEESRDINGSETDVEYRLKGDTASAFSDVVSSDDGGFFSFGDTAPSDGEIVLEMAATGDGTDVVPVYLNEAGDNVEDGDTYAVYDEGADVLTIHYGEDYADGSSVDPYVANHAASDENLGPSADELAEAYGHLSFVTRAQGFGTWTAIDISRSDADAQFGFLLPLAAAPTARRIGRES